MPRVGSPMSGDAGCRIHDTRKCCAGKLLCRIAHIPRHHPYLMRSEHITTFRRNKSSRNNLSKHWLRQQPASAWLIHPERDRSCTAFPAPQNGSCTMSKRLGSLRKITAARASRRRPATHGTADGRCHAAPPQQAVSSVRGGVQQPHYTLLWNTTTKLGMKLPSTHRFQKFRDPYSPEGGDAEGSHGKTCKHNGNTVPKIHDAGNGRKKAEKWQDCHTFAHNTAERTTNVRI